MHHQVLNDLSFRDVVKNIVLVRNGACKPTTMNNTFEQPPKKIRAEASVVKHLFKYLRGSVPPRSVYCEPPPATTTLQASFKKMDELD